MVNDNGLVNYCASRQRAHIRQMMEKKKKKEPRRARFTGPKLIHVLKCIAVRIDSFITLIWSHLRSVRIIKTHEAKLAVMSRGNIGM